MDRFEAMSILVAAAETGSLTAASRKLNVPLPTISRRIAELEAHLGTRLLARTTRRLALTDAGSAYFEACKRILDEVGDAERTAAGEQSAPKGDLVITAPLVFGRLHILPVITDFLALYPDINIRLTLSDRNVDLMQDEIDLALRIGRLPDSAMVATKVGELRRVVCGSPAFFAQHGIPATPQDLIGKPAVNLDVLRPMPWTFAMVPNGRQRDIAVLSRLAVNTAEAALDAAIAGVGITRVLSYQAANAVGRGLLQIVLDDFEPPPIPVFLLHSIQGIPPVKLRTFLDFAAPRLRRRIGAILAPAPDDSH